MFDGEWEFLLLALVFLALVTLVSWLIVTSSFGRVLTAIREDEQAIEVFGYQVTHYKLAIWVVSAMMAGLAGGLFSSWTSFIDPNSFILLESILLVSIVILGRAGLDLGLPSRRDGLRPAGGGNALPAPTACRARGSSASGGPRRTLGTADAVPAARTGGEVQAMSAADGPGPFALETDSISKRFGAVQAIDRLSLSIPRGKTTSIVGPNGSGKSTLVNLLSGTLPLDGGWSSSTASVSGS